MSKIQSDAPSPPQDASSQRPEQIPYHAGGPFGFTNDLTVLEAVRQWRDAAIADGWTERDMDNDPRRRRSHLNRDGYTAHTVTREGSDGSKWKCEAAIYLWGPDGPAIEPPSIYDWAAITAGQRHCPVCGRDGVETFRIAFANRACAECRPCLRAKLEVGNWTA